MVIIEGTLTKFLYMEGDFKLVTITLKSNRVWTVITWRDQNHHQHICHIHVFSHEHVELFHEAAIPNGFPYNLGCQIVDQYYLTACICDQVFEVD